MLIDRRAFTSIAMAALAVPVLGQPASIVDAAGRQVPVPGRVTRIFPAGPPAAIMLYTLAPSPGRTRLSGSCP
jgi:iron complex transport system substrate-binding protein